MRLALLALLAGCGARPPPAAPVAGLDPEVVPFSADERAAELRELRDALAESYSHLENKRRQWGVDLDEAFARHEPLVRRADTWTRYERVMVSFVSELHDAHVAWRRKRAAGEKRRRIVRLGLDTRFVGDALIVTEVWPGSGAERAGLRVGDRIVGFDGETVEQQLGDLAAVRSWSRLENARYDFAEEWPASRIDADAPPPERRVTRELEDGTYETLRVAPETTSPPGRRHEALSIERHGEAAVIRIRSLGGRPAEIEARFLALLAPLLVEPRGLVIDLRGNPGGYDQAGRDLAARLAAGPVVGGEVRVRLSARARTERAEWRELPEDPARPGWSVPQPVRAEGRAAAPYPRPIAVLVDAGCRSACESLALLLRATRARLLGERTGGSSGAPITVALRRSGARVTIPAWAMFDGAGRPIEGLGVAPDEEIAPTRADLTAARDPALARAIELVGAK